MKEAKEMKSKASGVKGLSILTILVGLSAFVEEVNTVVGELLDLLSKVLVLILSPGLGLVHTLIRYCLIY